MKIIVAGYPKTGTKSINMALTKLGYSVSDHLENVFGMLDQWDKIFNEGWTSDDFKQMYEDVDAVVDSPACYFWEDIHKAFPDAKIILTKRENDDIWIESMKKQSKAVLGNSGARIMFLLSPTVRKMMTRVFVPLMSVYYGFDLRQYKLNESLLKLKYNIHNDYVLQKAPKDKLLVFNCSEGWEPLCKFLNKPVPKEPFPRRNVQGGIIEEWMKTHPTMQKMKREAMLTLSVIIGLLAVGIYFLVFWAY